MVNVRSRVDEFDGQPLLTATWCGRACWIGRHLGRALGYPQDGKRLPTLVIGEWADEFIDGKDYQLLEGEDLATFQVELVASGGPELRQGRILLLFESGAWLAAAKADKAIGQNLRRFLADRVLPAVYSDLAASVAEDRELSEDVDRVLGLFPSLPPREPPMVDPGQADRAARIRERWVQHCDLRLRVDTLVLLAREHTNDMTGEAKFNLMILAAELATGLRLRETLLPGDDEPIAANPASDT